MANRKNIAETVPIIPMDIKGDFHIDDDYRKPPQIIGNVEIVVRCKDCRHANECHKSVQYTHNEQSTITIGYTPIEWCSRGERRET